MNKKFYFVIFIILLSLPALNLGSFLNLSSGKSDNSYKESNYLNNSNSGYSNLIVFFNQSISDTNFINVKNRFLFYGGVLKKGSEWNYQFESISGFAGSFPMANLSSFYGEFPDLNIEKDEIIETYLNYASIQTGAVNSTWDSNGIKGNTNASIAVIDSGIDLNNDYLQDKIIGWEDYTNDSNINDDYGHGTFISSVIAGTGIENPSSLEPTTLVINKSYSHSDLFEDYLPSKDYSFKILSFNATNINSRIEINSSWNLIENGIDNAWFELYYDSNLVNSSQDLLQNFIYQMNHRVSQYGEGVYDLYMRYHKTLNKIPKFSFNISLSYYPESYVQNYNYFTGIANASKIVAFKVVNGSGIGYTSDLISAMASLKNNRTLYQIVSACLSIGTLGDDVKAINRVINEVADSGIVIVIAAGNYGVKGPNPLNKLALTENSIVVGAINDKDQVASYSSVGTSIENNLTKPDLMAPGGSSLPGHRSILSAKENTSKATAMIGTSISAAITAAAINLLIDAKWGDWTNWNSYNTSLLAKMLKAVLLMTASETNLEREDDPSTDIDESSYSPGTYIGTVETLKDVHEGYGRININAAIDALTKYISLNESIQHHLTSSQVNPLAEHVFARKIKLDPNKQYLFNLDVVEDGAEFDLFLYANSSKTNGEPILFQSTRKWYRNSNSFYFTPKTNQSECVVIVKAYGGESDFILNVTNVKNMYPPELNIPEINYFGGSINATIISYQEFIGSNPAKNYSIDRFRFYIDYYDLDEANVPPQEVFVSIVETNQNLSLVQVNVLDDNYTDGALFRSSYIQFPEPGTYNYIFYASDGDHLTRFPYIGYFNITIEFPTDSEQFPYSCDFKNGWNNWTTTGTGWNILNQSNTNDNRSDLYETNWTALYYGRDHNYPNTYTYQPYLITEPYPNGSLISPLVNLTQLEEGNIRPYLKYGIRTSINEFDYIYFQINLNWTGWINLKTYTNEEREWFMEEVNLTEYVGYFVQFRFLVNVDDQFDPYQYKGFMLDQFAIFNYTNHFSPIIEFNIKEDVSETTISKFDPVIFSCRYFDGDNNYPVFLYLEIDEVNYSMINSIGDWSTNQLNKEETGILFTKSIIIGDLSNTSFRFHTSDGEFSVKTPYYNLNNSLFSFENPMLLSYNVIKNEKEAGYSFSDENLNDYYITGNPPPKEDTSWLMGDNSWHLVEKLNQEFIYGGKGQSYGGLENGYDTNWDIELITKPLHLKNEYDTYLVYSFEISLQNEFGLAREDLDRCTVSISTNFGESWEDLKDYYYDDDNLSGNESINLSSFGNEIIMIKFALQSNNINIGLGFGWLVSDIYIGYDLSTDFISPIITPVSISDNQVVKSFYELRFNISDNKELDIARIYLYIDGKSVNRNLLSYDRETKIMEYNWDTTVLNDGAHSVKITAFDKEGNWAELIINVKIQNGLLNFHNIYFWIIVIGLSIISGLIIYFVTKKRKNIWFSRRRALDAEKVRLEDIDRDQIIKKIELIELGDEKKRPLTLYCRYCKSWFQSSKFDYICPNCEHDQIYAAYNCLNCGKWYFKNEPAQDYYCSNKRCEGVRLIRREKFEVEDILAKEGKVLKTFKRKSKKFSVLD